MALRDDPSERQLEVHPPHTAAAGLEGVAVSMKRGVSQMGVSRMARTLTVINQPEGFDCPGCAWPEEAPGQRKRIEFCENGVKAVAEEATVDRCGPEFFAEHSLADLAGRTDYWLGQQGRLTTPMVKRPGDTHYSPIGWDAAFDLIGSELRSLDSPDQAAFYTSGRTANETAFAYQLFVRSFGTNNLPDCSNMCHEATGVALIDAIGMGKGSVRLGDFAKADVIVLVGQNPGTNHPRMLGTLEDAKAHGAKVITINPLPEAGLLRFKNPQRAKGVAGRGTALSDLHLPIRIGADLALFQLWNRWLLDLEESRGGTFDHSFIETHTHGYDDLIAHLRTVDEATLLDATGLPPHDVRAAFDLIAGAGSLITCWAMGVTQQIHATDTIREITNLHLLTGNIGREGAGLCPVRGHSNVQGDRTMGIWERPPAALIDRLEARFGFAMPRHHGYDVAETLEAMYEGRIRAFICMGGNFNRAIPDTDRAEEAMANVRLTVQVSTKLNRSHVTCGQTALILPTLGRTERDEQASGPQFITVEDSMGMIHRSQGVLEPASPLLRSEMQIVVGMARATFGPDHAIDWAAMADDYSVVRDMIGDVIVGFDRFNERIASPAGFELPHPPRDSRTFPTTTAKANFKANPFDVDSIAANRPDDDVLVLQTMRSHDQYNTTIYGLSDRYRGIEGGRLVVFVSPNDIARLGLSEGQLVDIVSQFPGDERVIHGFRVVSYPTPDGSCGAYYPETNPLIPVGHRGKEAGTPASKFVPVKLVPHEPASVS